jgi:flagellar basal body-associated protein FliL
MSVAIIILISIVFVISVFAIVIVGVNSTEKRQQKKEYEDVHLKTKANIIPVYDKIIEHSKQRPFYNIKHGGFYA